MPYLLLFGDIFPSSHHFVQKDWNSKEVILQHKFFQICPLHHCISEILNAGNAVDLTVCFVKALLFPILVVHPLHPKIKLLHRLALLKLLTSYCLIQFPGEWVLRVEEILLS